MVQGITKLFDTYHETILEHMTTYFVVNHSDLLFDMCVDNLSHITVDDDIVINYLLMTIPRKTLALLGIYIYIFFLDYIFKY
jgi:hypothetical protein